MDWVASWDLFDWCHGQLYGVMLAGTCWHGRGEWVGTTVADGGFVGWWVLGSFIDAAGSGSWLLENRSASRV